MTETITAAGAAAAARIADEWLAVRQRVLRVPGVQAAVAFDGEMVLDTAHGWADVESGVALTPRHLFRIASHSKTFTATVVLQLVEAGSLRLHDTVGDHLSWAPESFARVTVRELLGHASGISRDGLDSDHWILTRAFPDAEGLRDLLPADAAVLPPNERFKYSNLGFSLLGQIAEAASGRSFAQQVEDGIAGRLGLTDTTADLPADRRDEHATGYTALSYSDERLPIEQIGTGAMAPATGVSSTASDLVRYLGGFADGHTELLSEASKRLAHRDEWFVEGADMHYGLGFIALKVNDTRMIGHSGGFPGHITMSMLEPKTGLAVSVLTNAIDGPASELAPGIVKLVQLAGDVGDEPHDDLDRFTGAFGNIWQRLDVVRFGDRLLALSLNQADPTSAPIELTPEGDDVLRVTGGGTGYGGYGETMRYTFDGDTVTQVRLPGGIASTPLSEFASQLVGKRRISLGVG